MNQRRSSEALYWADEESTRIDDLVRMSGGNIWRLVWKRIEDSKPLHGLPARKRKDLPQPPCDYVVETDRLN